ncbi:MAG: CPBP family intramembrane metalloprotease [Clostridia bacterium]|nr:CPBP family intramembrane metalloprotease [Clostridia bacterium]
MNIYNDVRSRKNAERFHLLAISSCIGFAIILYALTSMLFSKLLGVIYNSMDYETYKRLAESSIFNNAVYIVYSLTCVALPFFLTHLIMRKCTDTSLLYGKPKKGGGLVPATVIGLGLCVLGNYATTVFTFFTEALFSSRPTGAPSDITSVEQISLAGFFVSVIATAVMPALVEEFAIRGVVMQPLRKYGDKFAVVISALVFSIIHGNFQQIPFAFVVGLALGYVVIRTGSIWAGVLLHFLNNFWASCSEYLSYLVPDWAYVIYSASNIVVCIAAIICAILLYKRDVKAGITSGVLEKPDCILSVFDKSVFVIYSPTFLVGIIHLFYSALQNFIKV